MKTEIDVHYLVALENDNKKKEEEINSLQEKLGNLNEYRLRQKSMDLAVLYFEKFCQDLFSEIGAKHLYVRTERSIFPPVMVDEYNLPDAKFEFGAEIRRHAHAAFVDIGIDFTKKQK